MKFLLPKHVEFFDLFENMTDVISRMSGLFTEFSAASRMDEEYAKRAKDIEHQGDALTHELISRLNKTFITPFDREDVYILAHELDDIVDLLENVIHNTFLYGIAQPVSAMKEFAPLVAEASKYLHELVVHLKERKHTPELHAMIVKIHELEDQGDAVFNHAIKRLFAGGSDPLIVVKEKDVLEGMENVMDKYQKVSDIIQGIIVKSS